MARRGASPPSRAARKRRYWLRKGKLAALVALLALAGVLGDRLGFFGAAAPPDMERYHGRTVRVARAVDGDTVRLALSDPKRDRRQTVVRLWGVDTPETVKPETPVEHYGPEAAKFTRRATEGKTVRLELVPARTRGRYDRVLAYLHLPDGRLLNAVLVEQGYAYADPRYGHPRLEEFLELQQRARRARRGLWAAGEPPKDLPHYWRGELPPLEPPTTTRAAGVNARTP